MKRSEMILIGFSALAALYGAYEFLLKPKSGGDTEPAKEDIGAFTAAIGATMTSGGYDRDRVAYLYSAVATPWEKDPFLYTPFYTEDSGRPLGKEGIINMDQGKYVYSSYLGAGDNRVAIINGLDFMKGDALDEYIIEEIASESVTLSKDETLFRLPIREEGHENE